MHEKDCPIKSLPEVSELLKIAKEHGEMTRNIQGGINKLLDSQVHVVGLLDELKPLRSLPDISNNLSRLVERLIEPAVNPKEHRDWPALLLVIVLASILVLTLFKEYAPSAKLKLLGSEASIETHHEEKKT
jgi:hypothetical protein